MASLSSVGQTGPDPGELPPWPPLSPAMAAAAVAATGTADPPPASADPPEVPGPDEPDDQPAALPGGPLARAPRSRLRFAAIAAVTVLLVVSAVLLVTPAHRPGRTATLAPPATVPAPTPGGTVGGPQSGPVGGASASGRPAGTATPPATQPAGPTPPTSPGAPSTGPSAPGPPPDPVSATWSVTVHNGPDAGYRVDVVLTNQGGAAVTGWQLVFALPPGETVVKADGAVYVQAGTIVTFTPKDANQLLRPGQKVPVRFEVKGSTAQPDGCTVNGNPCG